MSSKPVCNNSSRGTSDNGQRGARDADTLTSLPYRSLCTLINLKIRAQFCSQRTRLPDDDTLTRTALYAAQTAIVIMNHIWSFCVDFYSGHQPGETGATSEPGEGKLGDAGAVLDHINVLAGVMCRSTASCSPSAVVDRYDFSKAERALQKLADLRGLPGELRESDLDSVLGVGKLGELRESAGGDCGSSGHEISTRAAGPGSSTRDISACQPLFPSDGHLPGGASGPQLTGVTEYHSVHDPGLDPNCLALNDPNLTPGRYSCDACRKYTDMVSATTLGLEFTCGACGVPSSFDDVGLLCAPSASTVCAPHQKSASRCFTSRRGPGGTRGSSYSG